MKLTIANVSATIDDATLTSVVAAIGLQVSRDFQPEWNCGQTQIVSTKLALGTTHAPIDTASDAIIYLGDSSQDPTSGVSNAYGYHSTNYSHIPYGFVYLDVCKEYGETWSCTLSHEVLELLADPTAVLAVSGPDPQNTGQSVNYDLEVCDPTQGDTYTINSVIVSNFVTNAYFGMPGASHSTNFLNLALSPFAVRPGGYVQYEDGAGSHQINGSRVDQKRLSARKILGVYRRNARRSARRRSGHGAPRAAMAGVAKLHFSRARLHPPVITRPEHKTSIAQTLSALPQRQRFAARSAAATIDTVQIPLTTVSLNTNFDSYVDIWFKGAPATAGVQLLVDSGNSVLIVPRWEDIAALPNGSTDYAVLGSGTEPWGCLANIVRGPIDLVTSVGETVTIENCVFYACTADNPQDGSRTANFGAGCLSPWKSSGWNTPANLEVTLQAPLSYNSNYPVVEFNYAPSADLLAADGTPKVTTSSSFNLYKNRPAGYTMFPVLPNCEWMALTPKSLSIGATKTAWPGSLQAPIAMIDTGGGPVYLSDPNGYLYMSQWPDPVANPDWTSSSVACQSISDTIGIELGDAANSVSYAINPSLLPQSAQGLTLVMCQSNYYMMGQQGMNIGGISALVNSILIDYGASQVGFKPK